MMKLCGILFVRHLQIHKLLRAFMSDDESINTHNTSNVKMHVLHHVQAR